MKNNWVVINVLKIAKNNKFGVNDFKNVFALGFVLVTSVPADCFCHK